jgi:putative protease
VVASGLQNYSIDGSILHEYGGTKKEVLQMPESKVGEVVKFFAKPSVAAIVITADGLKVGDTIHFKGHTTDFTQSVDSMQIDNQAVELVKVGDDVGIKVTERVRPGDMAYKVTGA